MKITDAFLRDVARHYREAVERGESPNVSVARAFDASRRTAERWVYLARKTGHLDSTHPGRVTGRPRCPHCDQLLPQLAAFDAQAAQKYASMIGDDLPRAELLAQQRRVSRAT